MSSSIWREAPWKRRSRASWPGAVLERTVVALGGHALGALDPPSTQEEILEKGTRLPQRMTRKVEDPLRERLHDAKISLGTSSGLDVSGEEIEKNVGAPELLERPEARMDLLHGAFAGAAGGAFGTFREPQQDPRTEAGGGGCGRSQRLRQGSELGRFLLEPGNPDPDRMPGVS